MPNQSINFYSNPFNEDWTINWLQLPSEQNTKFARSSHQSVVWHQIIVYAFDVLCAKTTQSMQWNGTNATTLSSVRRVTVDFPFSTRKTDNRIWIGSRREKTNRNNVNYKLENQSAISIVTYFVLYIASPLNNRLIFTPLLLHVNVRSKKELRTGGMQCQTEFPSQTK